MFKRIIDHLVPPFFADDEEKTRIASLLNVIVLSSLAGAVFYLAFAQFERIPYIILAIAVILSVWQVMKRGYVRVASIAMVMGLLAVFVVVIFTGGGLRAPAYSGLMIVILFAGLILGWRSAVSMAIFSILYGILLLIADSLGMAPQTTTYTNIALWIIESIFFVMAGVFLMLALRTIEDAFRRANKELAERKQAEVELQQSEERYRNLIDQARDIIFTISNDGRITSLNPAFEIFTGWSRAEWLGRAFDGLVAKGDRVLAHDQFERILHGEKLRSLRLRMQARMGDMLVVEMNISPQFKDHQVIGLLGIARDMTRQQQVEDALRESEARYHHILDTMMEGCQIIDFDWRYLYVNATVAAQQAQLKPEEMLNHTVMELYPGVENTGLFAILRRCMEERAPAHIETEFIFPDGRLGLFDLSIQPAREGIFILSTDIAARKRAEEKLRESEKRYSDIFQVAACSIWEEDYSEVWAALDELRAQGVTDFRGYLTEHPDFVQRVVQMVKVLDVNETTLKLYGVKDKTEFLGSLEKFVNPDNLHEELIAFAEGRTYFEKETVNRRLDGKLIHFWMTITFFTDAAGVHKALVCLSDITESKRVEEEVRLSQLRLTGLVASAMDGIVSIDSQQKITLLNPAAEKMFGYKVEEMLGQPHSSLLPERYRATHARQVDHFGRTGITSRAMTGTTEVTGLRRNGEEFPVEASISQVEVGGQKFFTVILRDITERKQAEKLQESVYEIARAAMATGTLEELYVKIHTVLQDILPAQIFYIALYDRERDLLSFPYFQDAFDEPSPPGKPGRGLTEYVLRIGKPILATHELMNELTQSGQIELIGADSNEWLGVPLIVRDQVIGVMTVQSYEESIHFSVQDLEVMTYVSSQVASAIERKQVEEKLLASEVRYRRLFESAKDGILILDAEMGAIVDVNPFLKEMLGYSHTEFLGKQLWEIGLFKDIVANKASVQELQKNSYIRYENLPLETKDGRTIWVEFVSNVYAVSGRQVIQCNIRDITERRQAEEKVQRQNQRLKALREIDTAILAADSVEDIVGAALDHIRELIGCRRAVLGLIDWETNEVTVFNLRTAGETFVPRGSRIPLMPFQDISQALSKNQPVVINDLTELPDPPPLFQNLSREGLRSVCILPLFSQGSLIGSFSMSSEIPGFFDEDKINLGREVANQVAIAITQSRLVEVLGQRVRERENLVAELTAKNAELENFTYTVSHDLKSPLVTIKGFLGYLIQDAATGNVERLKEDTQRIANAVEKMQALLSDLLELSRIGRFVNPSEIIPFEELIRVTMDIVRGRLEARGVTVQIQPNLPMVYVDRQRLIDVLQNLLDNAAKYMGDQVEPRIEIGQRGEDAERGKTIFYVKDNGIGIAPEYRERVFGLFNKLDARSEGTGIGLALVRRIIEFHGGRIWVESDLEKGSAFCFTLPVT